MRRGRPSRSLGKSFKFVNPVRKGAPNAHLRRILANKSHSLRWLWGSSENKAGPKSWGLGYGTIR